MAVALLLMVPSIALAQPVPANQTTLPSLETRQAIEGLPQSSRSSDATKKPEFKVLRVNPRDLTSPGREKMSTDATGSASVPIAVPNTMILRFEPNAKHRNSQILAPFRSRPI
jgi:hypothetical protein